MIIDSIHIKKFRGFNDVQFHLGINLTAIAGQNGTQKTTLMGILSQSFTMTDKTNPLYGERPLCGGSYRSSFAEKFKLSDSFDKPKSHEWTLTLNNDKSDYTVESIPRTKDSSEIRFWKKGDRSKGSGYKQIPVIYLSLSRLFPIGEDSLLSSSTEISLTKEELKFYQEWHDKILIISNDEMTSVNYLASKYKNTLGANTSSYDWKMNSAGQDNIGKILLAILSFKRLSATHGNKYLGGILAIDELDATLYPASQLKLIEALRKFSSQFKIQIIFTTHSLSILEEACEWQNNLKTQGQTKVVYLEKLDSEVKAIENIPYETIKNKLNVAVLGKKKLRKIPVFTEDKEGEIFLKAIVKSRSSALQFFNNCNLDCGNFIELAYKKFPGFRFPNSLIVLDGDVKTDATKMKKINHVQNVILLPGSIPIEKLLAEFLNGLPENSSHWNNIYNTYSKQYAFKEYKINEIRNDLNKAKKWFNLQKGYWGKNCTRVINLWIASNQKEVDAFVDNYEKLLKKYNQLLN